MKSKGFFFAFVVYAVLMVVDIGTTLWNWRLIGATEVNLLFRVGGYIWIPVVANFVICLLFIWAYHKYSPTLRFIVINAMVFAVPIRAWGIRNALSWMGSTASAEQIALVVTPELKSALMMIVFASYVLPAFLSLVAFVLWRLDHHVHREEEVVLDLGKTRWLR